MMRIVFPFVAVLLVFGLAPGPAAAATDPVTDLLKDIVIDCGVHRTPTIVVVGLDPDQTVLSDQEAEAVRAEVETLLQDTGRVTVASGADVTRLKALQEGTTGLTAAAAEEQIRAAFTGDAVIFPVDPTRVGVQVTLRLRAIDRSASCKVTSAPVTLAVPAIGPENVDALMRQAVRNLVQSAPDATVVAVCPFTAVSGVSACSDRLTEKLLLALDKEKRSPDRTIRNASLEYRRLPPGDACLGAPGLVTSHGTFEHSAGQSWLDLSFDRGGAMLAPTGHMLIDPASIPCDPTTQSFLDSVAAMARVDSTRLDVTAAAPHFEKGERLEVKIALKAKQNLYCWLLDSDQTAYVALPIQGGAAAPLPSGTKRYPFDFGLGEMVAGTPFDNLFDCFSVAGDLPPDLQARWLASAPSAGSDAKLIERADVLDLLTKLRAVPGVVEASTRLVVR